MNSEQQYSADEIHPNPLVNEFIGSLSPMEKRAHDIAKSHLGTTFNIEKANAFLRWKKENGKKSHGVNYS